MLYISGKFQDARKTKKSAGANRGSSCERLTSWACEASLADFPLTRTENQYMRFKRRPLFKPVRSRETVLSESESKIVEAPGRSEEEEQPSVCGSWELGIGSSAAGTR